MEPARSTGNFNRKITVADSNNIITVLDMNATNAKYQIFDQDYLVEFQAVLEDLKITVGLLSLLEAPWPDTNALMSESATMAEIAKIRTQGQKISLGLYVASGNGPWQYESEVILQNQGGSETHVPILVPFLSSNETLLISGNFKLGVKIEPKWNQPLKIDDYLVIKGTWRQIVSFSKKKDDDVEFLAARIETLELALAGKLTELPANTLLGRDTITGIVQQIPQSRFATPAQITAAISNLIGSSSTALDTLVELGAALANDANFASTITNALTQKVGRTGNEIIAGLKTFTDIVRIQDATQSTSSTTGALILSTGGIGVGGNINAGGTIAAATALILPSVTGGTVGMLWRNTNNLEFKDSVNTTQILLSSAGNLSNLSNRQVALNTLVGTQTANRLLRSDGTNVSLAQVDLTTDVTGSLLAANGGVTAVTQTFTGAKTFSDVTSFGNEIRTTGSNNFWRAISGNFGVILRNDGTNFHLLLTDSGNQTGTWNSFRSFVVNLASGNVSTTGILTVHNTTQSTSSTTGALILSTGGIGVGGNINAGGTIAAATALILPSVTGGTVGMLWRNTNSLEFKDSANTTQILLSSAGNLSNLSNRQVALNTLVGTQTANRLLRSDGTNVSLTQVDLTTDVTGSLPVVNGGNFVIQGGFWGDATINPDNYSSGVRGADYNLGSGLAGWHFYTDIRVGNSGFATQLALSDTGHSHRIRSKQAGVWQPWNILATLSEGSQTFNSTTQSTSSTTGALILSTGGIGVGGNIFSGGTIQGTQFQVAGAKIIGVRDTGWTAPTGTANKGVFDSETATLLEVARRLFSLETAQRTHGLLGT